MQQGDQGEFGVAVPFSCGCSGHWDTPCPNPGADS